MKNLWNFDFKIGISLALLIIGMCIVGFFYTPYNFNEMNATKRFLSPRFSYIMGTDNFGRDVFSRIMIGGRYTLIVAILTVLTSSITGAGLGLISGYFGGIFDEILMRIMDALNSFPGILIALVMVSLMENKTSTLIIALLILFIPGYVRIMRSGTLQLKNADFVKIAQIIGTGHLRIIFIHIAPNLKVPLFSAIIIGLSNAILAEATMSYLGLGIQPPIPSWGRMLSESQNFLFNAPWCALAPGIMIMLTVISFHFIGEGISHK